MLRYSAPDEMQKRFNCIDTLVSQNTYIISRPGDIDNFYSNVIVDIVEERVPISSTMSCIGMVMHSHHLILTYIHTCEAHSVHITGVGTSTDSKVILQTNTSIHRECNLGLIGREGLHWTTTDDLTVTRLRQTWSGSHSVWHISTATDNSLTPLQTQLTHVSKSTDCGRLKFRGLQYICRQQ